MYLPPIQPCYELPTSSQLCQSISVRYWSVDSHWTFDPQYYTNGIGVKPGDDNNIFVPRCIYLIIDYPLPRIRGLRIDGIVEFQQGRNHLMYVDNILINGGRLIAGLPNNPFNGSVDIILKNTGSTTLSLPSNLGITMEPKMIGVMGGLDLHGTSRGTTWTRLAVTAASGQNVITLRQSVNWVVGDEIIITTTDMDIRHTERHNITNIENGTIISTATALANTHLVIQQTLANGQTINVAAAVGLLTRNVRVVNQNSGSTLSGVRIVVSEYRTRVWHIYSGNNYSTCYKGYARLSNTQFIGFGQLDDSYNTDQRSGIYMARLGDNNPSRSTFIDSCSFDGGFNAAIGMSGTNGIPITNNIIYNTYRSAIVVTGTNNIIRNNLVSTIYWLGTGQTQSIAQFSTNNDGAIMTRNVISMTLIDNLVSGVERLAYRIHGESCGGSDIYVPPNIINVFSNNEAHSAMSGVSLWPSDKGFIHDRKCVLIRGFTVYKAWYYGFYINTPRNITIDSCASIDSHVGIFTYVIGPSALTHVPVASRINIRNSLVVGSITEGDCSDRINPNSINILLSQTAIPSVSANSSSSSAGGRSGIVFPAISRNNFMPIRSWTGIGTYPCLDGLMSITNTTLAFFNDTCDRHDVAIQVSQANDDGQFPIKTSSMFVYNTSRENIIFNGQPNLGVVNPSRCGDMDCDGLKKNLIIDTDGSLFGQPASVFSHAESLWGSQQHGIGDFRIPRIAMTNLTGHRININLTYPYRGISRTNSCSLQSSWGMYICNSTTDYRMLIIESMDSDTEKRRISPVAIMSNSGYIDLINGPQDQSFCNGYSCRKRISTFMSIVQSGETYQIFFSSTPPKNTRFRLLNADSTIKCVLAVHYDSLQQIDVYANTMYIPPTNRDLRAPVLMLLDQPNTVTTSSPAGSNYFDRTYQMAYIVIDGSTVIDIRVSPLLILSFGFPPMDPASFFSTNLVANLAALLNINPEKIRRVNIVSASNQTRIQRRSSSVLLPIQLQIEMRDEPRSSTTSSTGIRAEILANIASTIINRYQAGELQVAWRNLNVTNGTVPSAMSAQEPFDNSSAQLNVINRISLVISPRDCRQQSPCTFQPVLVAYDTAGNVIQKLGSNERPWQVKATITGRPNLVLPGGIANYSDGQTQYSLFGLPDIGAQEVQFTLLQPDGVNSSFLTTANLTAQRASISVTRALPAGQQVNNIYVTNVNETFDISVMPIDSVTRLRLGQVQWGGWRWLANVTLYSLPKFNPQGMLLRNNLSATTINPTAGTVTVTNLAINAVGMYVLEIRLVSSNNEYTIVLPSTGILVKETDADFITETDAFSSNITFAGDFDSLNASGELEIKRVMIYNYLLSLGMPLVSDILLVKGSVASLFQVGSLSTDIADAVASILSGPNAVPGLTVLTVNVNGRSFLSSRSSSSSGTSASDPQSPSNNIGLIVGLVVGLVGGLLVVFGLIWSYRAHKRMQARHRPKVGHIDDDRLTGIDGILPSVDTHIRKPSLEKIEFSPVSDMTETSNRLFSAQSLNHSGLQSADCSVNFGNVKKPVKLPPLPAMELISFD